MIFSKEYRFFSNLSEKEFKEEFDKLICNDYNLKVFEQRKISQNQDVPEILKGTYIPIKYRNEKEEEK